MTRAIVLLMATGLAVFGQAPPKELKELLVAMRGHALEHLETRGATPDLTRVKQLLRDWIESRLPPQARISEPAVLAHQLNSELGQAGLSCDYFPDAAEIKCPDQALIGYLGKIQIHWSGGFLVVQTAVGILCGHDESAYAYEWAEKGWRRFWESGQNDYTKEKHLPQHLHGVLISPADYGPEADKAERIILTLGANPWCSSNMQSIHYRVWYTKSGYPRPKLLLDETEIAFLGEPVQGVAWKHYVLIEYAVYSIDIGVHNRRQIRHYVVNQGGIKREDPVVLSPRDFVDFWLTGGWTEVSRWTEATAGQAMEKWHENTKGRFQFIYPTCHCTQQPDLWQVGVQDAETERPVAYFLIRWRPPYHFRMVGILGQPWPNCTEEDPEADEFRTLFPDRDWR